MSRFAGRAAIVTGAAQGIGREIVARFLREGASVVAVDKQDRVEELSADRCLPAVLDQSDPEQCRRAVRLCAERFGRVDVVCPHAGIAEPMPLLEMTDEQWRRHFAVNVDGTMYLTREAARVMADAGTGGAVVCTSSINAWFVEETHTAYNVTKAAVWTFVRSAAMDLARHGIRVNGVAPGVVDTPIAELVVHNPQLAPHYLRTIPLARFGQPADVAACVMFLASSDADYITGQTIVIDGGQTLGIPGDLEDAATATSSKGA
jgi:NAD(P)-dependent dehydrogenase (short-subunit alcohol dehydrogenase family)